MQAIAAKIDAGSELSNLAHVRFDSRNFPLNREQREVFEALRQAADHADSIFWSQSCPEWQELRTRFASDLAADKDLRRYFEINYGPYDRLAGDAPFLPVGSKPLGAGFYPPDLTKRELLSFLELNPTERNTLLSPYTIVRRRGKRLCAIPYHEAFSPNVEQLATALEGAATVENREAYRLFLRSRARAVRTDDYYNSDIQWIDLPAEGLDVVIGPYETYEDELMGVKASYEAMVTLNDRAEAQKVQHFLSQIDEFQDHMRTQLHIEFDSPGRSMPLTVADLLYSAGDARKGIPSIAFTLPNDARVIREKGAREVILRNVLAAKFESVMLPICEALKEGDFDRAAVSDEYVNHTVLHEISHSLGPHAINVGGEETTVNRALGDLHTTFEEAKADVLGACWLLWAAERAPAGPDGLRFYVPGLIRSIRFGTALAHGRANLLQFNYLVDRQVITPSAEGTPQVVSGSLEPALLSLAGEILRIQASGDYHSAARFWGRYGRHTGFTHALVRRLEHLPVDINISFSIA